ncbi:Uma2 family endonuclease [Spirosoma harenae]
MQHPAPDLAIEILSKGTAKRDRGIKFEDYAAYGIREYWLVDPTRQTVEQFQMDGEFMAFDAIGNFHLADTIIAITIPGFTIPVRAIFDPKAQCRNAKRTVRLINPPAHCRRLCSSGTRRLTENKSPSTNKCGSSPAHLRKL